MSADQWIASTIEAAKMYEAKSVFGSSIGQITYGCINKLPRCLAVYAWCKSIQDRCGNNLATIAGLPAATTDGDMPDSYINYGSLGACPWSILQIAAEIAAAPTITSFTPGNGAGGITVTITGTNFTGTTAVKVNNVAMTSFSVVNATTITCVIPTTGFVVGHITVTNATGSVTSAQSYYRG